MVYLVGILGYIIGFGVCLIMYNNQSRKHIEGIFDILRRMVVTEVKEGKE